MDHLQQVCKVDLGFLLPGVCYGLLMDHLLHHLCQQLREYALLVEVYPLVPYLVLYNRHHRLQDLLWVGRL